MQLFCYQVSIQVTEKLILYIHTLISRADLKCRQNPYIYQCYICISVFQFYILDYCTHSLLVCPVPVYLESPWKLAIYPEFPMENQPLCSSRIPYGKLAFVFSSVIYTNNPLRLCSSVSKTRDSVSKFSVPSSVSNFRP